MRPAERRDRRSRSWLRRFLIPPRAEAPDARGGDGTAGTGSGHAGARRAHAAAGHVGQRGTSDAGGVYRGSHGASDADGPVGDGYFRRRASTTIGPVHLARGAGLTRRRPVGDGPPKSGSRVAGECREKREAAPAGQVLDAADLAGTERGAFPANQCTVVSSKECPCGCDAHSRHGAIPVGARPLVPAQPPMHGRARIWTARHVVARSQDRDS